MNYMRGAQPIYSMPDGDGKTPVWKLLLRFKQWGYQGMVSVEHEPAFGDPAPALKKSLEFMMAHINNTP